MATFEQVAIERRWFSDFGLQRGEAWDCLNTLTPPDVDIDEVLSLTMASLQEDWDENDGSNAITRKLWARAKLAVRQVRSGYLWAPDETLGPSRTRQHQDDVSYDELTAGGWEPQLPEPVEHGRSPWWAQRVEEAVDGLTPAGRGDAFRMHAEGLGDTEIGRMIDVDPELVKQWNRYSGNLLARELGDVAEALGLAPRGPSYGFPVTWGMVHISETSGWAQGHDAGLGIAEHRLRELMGGGDHG